MVIKVKYKTDGSVNRFKATLVAKGFQQTTWVNYFEIFSLVIKPSTIQVVFTLVATYGWDI